MNIIRTKNIEEIAHFVFTSINKQLELGRSVLFFVSGGSAIDVEVLIAQKIEKLTQSILINKLVVTLADERYGPVNHSNSNWFSLKKSGFNIKGALLIPYLTGCDYNVTTENIKEILKEEFNKADYKIGVFGLGVDGHTAGILPHSLAVDSDQLISSYHAGIYDRITITPKAILMLDEAILYAYGESKWSIIKGLESDNTIVEQPAQILKSVPLLTIFSDLVDDSTKSK